MLTNVETTAMPVQNFVAGFVYGMTGNDYLGGIEEIQTLETEGDAQEYYKAGEELANSGMLYHDSTYGDVHCVLADGDTFDLTTKEVADYIAGFMYGLTSNNHQAQMETCFKDTP